MLQNWSADQTGGQDQNIPRQHREEQLRKKGMKLGDSDEQLSEL